MRGGREGWEVQQTANSRQLMVVNIHHDLNCSLLFPWKRHQLAVHTRTHLTQTWENSKVSVCHMTVSHGGCTTYIPTSWVGISLYCTQKLRIVGEAENMNFCH